MERRANCWEVKRCGREPGGANATALGACPAATETLAHGFNGGMCGGRICWAIGGTFCGGVVQGSSAQKLASCMLCPFFKQVREEEDGHFLILLPDQTYHVPEKHHLEAG